MNGAGELTRRRLRRRSLPRPWEPSVIHFVIDDPIERADVPRLCDRLRALLDGAGADRIECNVSTVEPDATTVDALARLQLIARRLGFEVRLSHASGELCELVELMGLQVALPLSDR